MGVRLPPKRPLTATPPGSVGRKLDSVPFLKQHRGELCWAACARMVLTHLQRPKRTECQVSAIIFPAGPCNQPCTVSQIDLLYRRLNVAHQRNGRVSFQALRDEIDAKRPVQVVFNEGGGRRHAALVVGWKLDDDGDRWVLVHDPLLRPGFTFFEELVTFNQRGSWDFTWYGLS